MSVFFIAITHRTLSCIKPNSHKIGPNTMNSVKMRLARKWSTACYLFATRFNRSTYFYFLWRDVGKIAQWAFERFYRRFKFVYESVSRAYFSPTELPSGWPEEKTNSFRGGRGFVTKRFVTRSTFHNIEVPTCNIWFLRRSLPSSPAESFEVGQFWRLFEQKRTDFRGITL